MAMDFVLGAKPERPNERPQDAGSGEPGPKLGLRPARFPLNAIPLNFGEPVELRRPDHDFSVAQCRNEWLPGQFVMV